MFLVNSSKTLTFTYRPTLVCMADYSFANYEFKKQVLIICSMMNRSSLCVINKQQLKSKCI